MVFWGAFDRRHSHGMWEALLWVVAVFSMSERNISYTPTQNIATGDRRYYYE